MWIVISGDFFDGILEVVGPFYSESEAETYMDSHNMQHGQKAVKKLTPNKKSFPVGPHDRSWCG